jgi:hypothetical protein
MGAAVAVGVLTGTSGCGFLDAVAHPDAQQAADVAAGLTAQAAAPPAPPAFTPGVIAEGELVAAGGPAGTVQLTTGSVQTGLVLPFPAFSRDCPVDGAAMQYVPVDVVFELTRGYGMAGLAGHLTVTPGPSTPADIGDLGVFFEPSWDDDEYCSDAPPLPTTDTFWAQGTIRVTGYVVLDQAVGPATPEGRTEVFRTLQVQLSELRIRGQDGDETPVTLGSVSTGALCPDDPDAFCVPLG